MMRVKLAPDEVREAGGTILHYIREQRSTAAMFARAGVDLYERYFDHFSYVSVSDHPGTADYTINLSTDQLDDATADEWTFVHQAIPADEVVRNERIFRLIIPYERAIAHVFAASISILRVLRNVRPALVISHTVDAYVVDVLARLCDALAIPVIGLSPLSFRDDLLRITVRGEYNRVRQVPRDEVTSFVNQFQLNYNNSFAPNPARVYRKAARSYATYQYKRWYHYAFKYQLLSRFTYQNLSTRAAAYVKSIPTALTGIAIMNSALRSDRLEVELDGATKSAFLPLHLTPEATTEYWVDSEDYYYYELSLLRCLRELTDKGYTIFVKEHPMMYMKRPRRLYDRLQRFPSVRMVHPFELSTNLVTKSDLVVIQTGSVGVEAIMLGTAIVRSEAVPYYCTAEQVPSLFDRDWESALVKPRQKEKMHLAERVLSNCVTRK